MDVAITSFSLTETGFYAAAACGRTSAYVSQNAWEVRVICQNASHRAHRFGSGRAFKTFEEATAAYKKPEMKAIIQAVKAHQDSERVKAT